MLEFSPKPYQDDLLEGHVRAALGSIDAAALAELRAHLQWVEVPAGQTLMAQGEPGDAMYLSISGRLRAYVRNDDGDERMVREMARGEVIGEMSLYTDEPRSATVVAIRDSVLVRLGKAEFNHLVARNGLLAIAITRQIIRRLQSVQSQGEQPLPVTVTLLPITAGVAAGDFAERLAAQLRRQHPASRICVIDAESVDRDLRQSGLARSDSRDADLNRHIAMHLDEVEAAHDYVLLRADDTATAWTERCARRCDELLLLADAAQPAELHDSETRFLMRRAGRAEAAEILVLLHPADRRCPSGTRQWLARRPLTGHLHIRPGLERDMARLARVQSRSAVGLVLAGGGARGLAHLGLYQALLDHGVEVDFVGGTSIGAVMAALIGSDQPWPEVMAIARRAFSGNPTGDFNLLPLLSLVAGKRLQRIIGRATEELLGSAADIEDLWKPFYCVASNYSQSSEHVSRQGPLVKALMASVAIPGALPPVLHDGELLCDGGSFNNFPVDVMRAIRGVGKVIGVDLSSSSLQRFEHDEVPGAWPLLRDRLRPRHKRRYRFPTLLAYLMNVTVMYSTSRERESRRLTDLYFNPPLPRIGMLQWGKFDSIVAQGFAHGKQVLDAMSAQALQAYR